jgi:predicted Zn-dependent peptidase
MDNGLRVVCCEMPHLHAAELAIYLKVGGRNDPRCQEGLSHFLEHILFRGTSDFASSLEIETAFESIGGAPNAATDAEATCFYSRVHPDHIKRGMEIFASMLMRPLLDGVDIEKKIIAEEAREELNENGVETNPDSITSRLLWPGHPLGMPTIGTLASIAAITRENLARHLAQYYVPKNTVVTVAGPVQSQQVFATAAKVFGRWLGGMPPKPMPVTWQNKIPRVHFVNDSDSQMSLQFAFIGFPRGDSRFMSLRILRRLLAGGGSSRLHLRLREELGIVYSVEAAIAGYEETGCMAVDFQTAPETLLQAIEVVLYELARIISEPVATHELERIRQSYIFDLEFSRDSAYEIGGRYGWGELMGLVRSIEDDQEDVRNITAAYLQDTARMLFAPANLRLVVVGPWKRGMKKRTYELVKKYAELVM